MAILPVEGRERRPQSCFSGSSTGSRRREGPVLTLIPEVERTIEHRLEFIIVGKGARMLSERIVNSDFNDMYRPRATPKPQQQHAPDGQERRHSVDSVASSMRLVNSDEDTHLVFFCPSGPMSSSLARVRLHVVEGFTASMPPLNDESAARDACVTLLHWRSQEDERAQRPSRLPKVEEVEETVQEFTMRAAEMNHNMRYMPLVFLLGINEAQEGMRRLEEAVSKKVFKDGRRTKLFPVEDNSDDGILDAIQDLVRVVIKERSRALFTKADSFSGPSSGKSSCCTVS